ncbi:unnamed protein product [Camellia sinensis]
MGLWNSSLFVPIRASISSRLRTFVRFTGNFCLRGNFGQRVGLVWEVRIKHSLFLGHATSILVKAWLLGNVDSHVTDC